MEKKIKIIEILMNSFGKFITNVKKNGVGYSTWAIILFLILYTFIINPLNINDIVEKIADKNRQEHNESIDKRLLADELIPEILDKLRIKYNLDRVSLLEMHNSTSNINDVSFLYMSLIYESIDSFNDSINFIADDYQQTRTSEYSNVLKELQRKGHLYIDNLKDCKNPNFIRMTKKMSKNGTNSALFYPIYNGKRIDGMIVFSSTKNEFDYQSILININKPLAKIKKLIIYD